MCSTSGDRPCSRSERAVVCLLRDPERKLLCVPYGPLSDRELGPDQVEKWRIDFDCSCEREPLGERRCPPRFQEWLLREPEELYQVVGTRCIANDFERFIPVP